MVKRIAILLLIFCLPVHATITLVKREFLDSTSRTNVGSIASTNTYSFDTVVGTTPVYGVGSKNNGASGLGFSALFNKTAQTLSFTSTVSRGMFGAWWRFNQFCVNISNDTPLSESFANSIQFAKVVNPNAGITFRIGGSGHLYVDIGYDGGSKDVATLTQGVWYFIAAAWTNNTSKTWVDIYLNTASEISGGSFTKINGFTNNNSFSAYASFQVYQPGGSYGFSGLCSAPGVYTLDSIANAVYPSDIVIPPTNRVSWYVNPNSGADLNDGLDGSRAWKTSTKLSEAMRYGGVRSEWISPWIYTSNGTAVSGSLDPLLFNQYATNGTVGVKGDAIFIDTSSGTPLTVDENILTFAPHSGIEIAGTNGTAVIDSFKALSTFTQYDAVNFPNVWQTSDSESEACLFEDYKWMNNPVGVNITAVRTNLNTTPNSFWNGGATLYFSTSDGTDPNSNGKAYRRSASSKQKGVSGQNNPLQLLGFDTYVHDLKIWGPVFRNQSTGAIEGTRAIENDSYGRTVIDRCDLRYGGNHTYAATQAANNLHRLLSNTTIQQGCPWTPNSNGYGQIVEFSGDMPVYSRRAYYWNCNMATQAIIGSASGVLSNGVIASHGTVSTNGPQYEVLDIRGCRGLISLADNLFTNVIIDGCDTVNYQLRVGTNFATITRSVIGDFIVGNNGGIVSNCICKFLSSPSDGIYASPWQGVWTVANSVFDAGSLVTPANGAYHNPAFITATNLTAHDNIFIAGSAFSNCVFYAVPPYTITSTNNVFQLGSYGYAARSASDTGSGSPLTFPQWKALSEDAGSFAGDACLGPGYHPYSKTPCWTTGTELGPATDITGKLFQSRKTCGAYEFTIPDL